MRRRRRLLPVPEADLHDRVMRVLAEANPADGLAVFNSDLSGGNDPAESSERAIWVDGEPTEPGPVEFDGLDGIRFDDGSRLDFAGECERHMQENRLLVSYSYRQPLGAFSGTLPGGIALARGLGVMEYHDAHW